MLPTSGKVAVIREAIVRRRYVKLLYEKWDGRLDIEEAIAASDYQKSYFLDESTVGRVDMYEPGIGLFNVFYRHAHPPFDTALDEHLAEHPDVPCAFDTPPVPTEEGLFRVQSYHYLPSQELKALYELHVDARYRVIRQVEVGEHGERLGEERYAYDPDGWVSTTVVDGAGEVTRVYHRDDD